MRSVQARPEQEESELKQLKINFWAQLLDIIALFLHPDSVNLSTTWTIFPEQLLRNIMVSGAYKVTPIQALEAEIYVLSIWSHLMQLQAKSRYRMRSVGQTKLIAKVCKRVAAKLKGNMGL